MSACRPVRLSLLNLEDRTAPAAGVLDPTFDGDGIVTFGMPPFPASRVAKVIALPDGKVLAAGTAVTVSGVPSPFVARFNVDGTLDTTFDGDGINVVSVPDGSGSFVGAALSGTKIVAVGTARIGPGFMEVLVAQFNSDGSLDNTFDTDGIVLTELSPVDDNGNAIAVQADGRIVVAGSTQVQSGSNHARMLVLRYFSNGALDPSFGGTGFTTVDLGPTDASAAAVMIQPDGKIVAAGPSSTTSGNLAFSVVRITWAGALDNTFDGDGIVKTSPPVSLSHSLHDAALTNEGKIVAVGVTKIGIANRPAVAALRYNADGSLDTSFGGTGYVLTDMPAMSSGGVANAVAVQADGKIIAAGATVLTGGARSMLLRYRPDGTLDPSFGEPANTLAPGIVITDVAPNATEDFKSVDLRPDGAIVAAGGTIFGTIQELSVARYANDTLTAGDDTYSTPVGATLSVPAPGIKANDLMPGKAVPLIDILSGPTHAASFGNDNFGAFSYTPAAGFVGQDSFTYRLRTSAANSNIATVVINVTVANQPPVAADDAYNVSGPSPFTVSAANGVLKNDTDPDGNTLHAILVSQPAQGTVNLNDDGSFSFTFPSELNGSVTFTYKVNDGIVDGNTATVTLTRVGNQPPVAVDDSYILPPASPLVVAAADGVLKNDSDPESQPITATLVSTPGVGTLTFQSDGSFTYDFPNDLAGSVTFTYKVSDGSVDSPPATVTLTRRSSISVSAGVLEIVGSDADDVVRLRPVGTAIQVEMLTAEGVVRQLVRPELGLRRFLLVNVTLGPGDDRLEAALLRVPTRAVGGSGDDYLRTGTAADIIFGDETDGTGTGTNAIRSGAGDDNITVGDGQNAIDTGNGRDTVTAGDGNNAIVTGAQNDVIIAGDGVNEIDAGVGNDSVTTGAGGSLIDAGAGNDVVTAAGGNNFILGGAGRDVLVAGAGFDRIVGGLGNDLIAGGLGADALEGNGGNDILIDGTVALVNPVTDSLSNVLANYVPTQRPKLVDISNRITVTFDTASADSLTGGVGIDWFWSNDPLDVLDRLPSEPLNEVN